MHCMGPFRAATDRRRPICWDCVNDIDWDGRTPLLHVAAEKDKPDMVRLLTLMGADKDATDNDGWAPLLNAAFFGRTAAALALGCLRGCQCSMPPDERVGGMYGGSTRACGHLEGGD